MIELIICLNITMLKVQIIFGKLNYNLKLIGLNVHDPTKETLLELKKRISCKQNNKSYIYINKESYFSRTIGEYDYDFENEEKIIERIKNKEDPLEWTKK